jgi:hypothetical protein
MTDTAKLYSVPLKRTELRMVYDFDDAVLIHEGHCSVQPFLAIEDEIDRDTTISQCRLISDDSGFYQATAQNYIMFDDVFWKIDGRPFIWRLFGRVHHIELNMRLVEG